MMLEQFIHLSQRDLAEKKQQQFVSNECRKINSILIEKNLKHKFNNNFNNLFCLTHSNQCWLQPTKYRLLDVMRCHFKTDSDLVHTSKIFTYNSSRC